MKISTKGQYAVRLMADIAKSEEVMSITSIAKLEDISPKYLEQIVALLVKAGLLESSRGAMGGYRLAKSADKISIKDILETTNDTSTLAPCMDGTCKRSKKCEAKNIWANLGGLIDNYLESVSLADLLKMN